MPDSAARTFARITAHRPPSPESPSAKLGTAVVLGGSIAGLLAARVLADHAEHVLVIERDELADAGNDQRPGVAQGTQVHALLPAGRNHLDRWFPGFSDEAIAEGATEAAPQDRNIYSDGRLKVKQGSAVLLLASRPCLEGVIRRRTLALPNVTVVQGRATGLQFSSTAVTGAHYVDASRGTVTQEADLVVNAMGRSSRVGDWLAQADWEKPLMRRMTVNINYVTALLRRVDKNPSLATVLSLNTPAHSSEIAGATYAAIEGDRWIVMMAGYEDHHPGRTTEDFVRHCRESFTPEFGELVENDFLGDVVPYRHSDSRRRDYHALERLPAGLVSVGDAVASFNPIYGQGMSSAALHASCLSLYLRSGPDLLQPASEFFDLQRVVVDSAWQISTNADLSLPHVKGPYPRGYRVANWLIGQIVTASGIDPVVGERFDNVTFMLKHPSTLLAPGTLARSFRANLRDRLRSSSRASKTSKASQASHSSPA